MDWSLSVFQPAFIRIFWGYFRTPPSKRDMTFVDSQLSVCYDLLEILNKQLNQQPYLAGKNFSLADIPAGSAIYRLTEQGLDVKLPPNVENWYQLLKQREGYQLAIMSDFSELAAREEF